MTSPNVVFTMVVDDQAVDFDVAGTPGVTVSQGAPDTVSVVVEDDQAVDITVAATPAIDISAISPPFTVVTVGGPARPPGSPGASGDNTAVTGEIPAGAKNGTNTVFTLANDFQAGSTAVYRNGIRELLGYSYAETPPNQITLSDAPSPTDIVAVDYLIN